MNIRLRFKLIALLIVLSLAGLLVFQGYWLKGLYDTLYKQMEINIEEAMKIADYKELFLRIRSIKKEQGALGPQTQDVYSRSWPSTVASAPHSFHVSLRSLMCVIPAAARSCRFRTVRRYGHATARKPSRRRRRPSS